ncbi:hypothetical protein L9F63_018735 [Diploptera punctata]|uniref:Uncharacterized protein n=1 Tax=Diploptera punctata TaxID=6984 RepID=A0AAD8EFI7_DIPPU|nr:hypothetical protein L9F63_018735 [Diploptera punctata]
MQLSIVLVVLCIAVTAIVALPHHLPQHTTEKSEVPVRVVRSPGDDKKGHVHAGVHEESGKGVVVDVNGKRTVYESDNGKSRVNVEGSWSKVVDGPQRGKPQHSAGASWDFDF